jgi:hypothetical protein
MADAALSVTLGPRGASTLILIVPCMTHSTEIAHAFFDRYEKALLARDENAIARMYAVPSLILFPGNPIVVSDAAQTEAFFASSWSQYDGVHEVDKQVVVMAEAPASIWADVTWSFQGRARERFCYQLVEGRDGYQIAVLTPCRWLPIWIIELPDGHAAILCPPAAVKISGH